MKNDSRLRAVVASVVAAGLGLLVAALDLVAPFGDDSAQFTVLLWLACCGGLGFAMPRRPWRWAVLVGPWLPSMSLILHCVRTLPRGRPLSYTDLVLFPFALGVCLLGAYSGALARWLILPPSSPVQTCA